MSVEKKVTTITGEVELISKCRKFENNYYKIGNIEIENSGDCQIIDGKYYRLETGQVVYDNEKKIYCLKNGSLAHGVIKFEKGEPVFGYFSRNNLKNNIITIKTGHEHYLFDNEIIKNEKSYRERLSNGRMYHIDTLSALKFNQIIPPSSEYKTSLPYDSGNVLSQYIKTYEGLNLDLSKNVLDYHTALGDLSFGLEFETIAGFLPDNVLNNVGLIPLRDGSISGIEYVTVPVNGSKGLQTSINAIKALKLRTKYDDSCALHLHIGNVPRTPEFILAMLKMTCATQDEMYSMFPLYKKYNFGVKNKNYSKPYPIFELMSQLDPVITSSNIDSNFNILFRYLSMGADFRDYNNNLKNVNTHPADPENRAKWNIHTRYYLNNLIPLIFGNKQTVEFRIHTSTFDVNKVISFIMINTLLVNYVIENTKQILEDPTFLIGKNNINITNIIKRQIKKLDKMSNNCKTNLSESLSNYISNRKQYTESNNARGVIIGDENEIPSSQYIDWSKEIFNSQESESVEHVFRDLETRQQVEEKFLKYQQNLQDLQRKGLVSASRYTDLMRAEERTFLHKKSILQDNDQW